MMMSRLATILLLFCLASTLQVPAQSTVADRQRFDETKARAEKGDAEAAFKLGWMYASGTGVKPHAGRAFKWYRQAAERGLARAQYQVALDYASGTGVKLDLTQTVYWLQKAADQGLVEAEIELGSSYFNGEGVPENAAEAARWFRKAADQGAAGGIYQLGRCYLDGRGVTKDVEQGIKLVRQAAEQGYAPAQNRLAQCYAKGIGVAKDGIEAYKWFTLAAAQDDELAVDIRVDLAKLESNLTPEQVAQAQKLAREFKPAGGLPAAGTAGGDAPVTPAATANGIGQVNVLADEAGSEIFVDGSFVGNPPARLKLPAGQHVIEVKQAGFKSYRRDLQVGSGADLTLRVALEKQ